MRAGQGGSDKEGRIQSHPVDKLHMDNRLTDQGVEEVGRSKCGDPGPRFFFVFFSSFF